jgi:hypothetical protein
MKAIITSIIRRCPVIVKHATWGVDPEGWLLFRNEAGDVCYVIKDWDSIEIVEEGPATLAPDDALDALDMKRGFCDC